MFHPTNRQEKEMEDIKSSCPFGEVSVIAFKNSQIMWSHFCKVQKRFFPTSKNGVTILVYIKGSDEKAKEFQPITL